MSWQGYRPPPGPPPGSWQTPPPGQYVPPYGPPNGPPPGEHHHQGHHMHEYNQYGEAAPGIPPRPSSGYAPPNGPPPGGWGGGGGRYDGGYGNQGGYSNGGYAPPPGPPPMPPQHIQNYGPQFQGPNGNQMTPYFQYSQCTGRKKALCIGINYFRSKNELKGCINDARNMREFLCRQFGYQMDDIVLLTDDQPDPRAIPTRANIINAMHWLVRDAQPNDSLFLHYSGHGGQTPDLDGDEDDGYDEVIYPVDFEQSSHIVDDEMFFTIVKPLPPGCRLTAIFDSCHSGSVLDLPYIYTTEGKIKEPNLLAEAGQGLLGAGMSYMRGDISGMLSGAMGLFKTITNQNSGAEQVARQTRTAPCDAISFGGCKDSQTSADTVEAGLATGAMSYAFIRALSQNPQQSYQQLLVSIRAILASEYSQKPQLSSSHPIDTSLLFIA